MTTKNDQAFQNTECFLNTTKQEQTTNNQKENTMTEITTFENFELPDVATLTPEQKTAYQIQVSTRLNNIKDILTKGAEYVDSKNRNQLINISIQASSWLLMLDVDTVKTIKEEAEKTKRKLEDVYKEYNIHRKEWENRKDLTVAIIEKIKQDSLNKLHTGKWNTNDIPTISKALKEIKKTKPAKMGELSSKDFPQLNKPDDLKFRLLYVDLATDIDTKELSKYIADDSVGFFWLDDSNLQQSFDTIKDLGFVVKEIACWDTDKSHNGAFSTRRQKNMVIACKGKTIKPSTFKLDSVYFEYESKNTGFKPVYYAEIIRQMFPNLPVLEVYYNGSKYFKYIETDYTLDEVKSTESK